MRQFLKFFAAALLALIVFTGIGFLLLIGLAGAITAKETASTGSKAVLYLDLSDEIKEQTDESGFKGFGKENFATPGLYDLVTMIRFAKTDSSIKGIYIKCNDNPNGFATSEELRNALLDFKGSKKFVYAYGDVISQKAYMVANVADKIYCNPKGGVDWRGFAVDLLFFKKALDKLEIEPRVFYAGKFKSATEPFRAEKMTDANRLQTQVFLNDLYNQFLLQTSQLRNIDTNTLHNYANTLVIRSAGDAANYKLIDGVRYDDEIKDELRKKLGLGSKANINFVEMGKYADAVSYKTGKGTDRIALIYAQGDIVDGKGSDEQIGGDKFRSIIRKARFDDNVKAIVIRVNSGGGSALASENMWREIGLAKRDKPVVLSFGDYAASGGYYMSCNADSIFSLRNTITGSIGVFSLIPNFEMFMKNKLGVTFDGVKTATYAGTPSAVKALSATESSYIQNDVDSIYHTFLSRVADGRKMPYAQVDSIAQGRVWTGERAIGIGLVDKIGGLQNAIDCAARLGKLKTYRLKEYPEAVNIIDKYLRDNKKVIKTKAIKEEIGADGYKIYQSLQRIRSIMGSTQAAMPFEMIIR
jgi:protease IV